MLRAFLCVPSGALLNWKKNKDDTTVCFLVLTNHILSAPRREREFNKMGLFDALPPLVSSTKVKVKEDDDDDDETRHTEKKRKIGNDDEEKLKVEVVVKSSVSSMDDRLEKLSKHVEKKFSTCTRAFLELVSKPEHASALERKHGKKILLVMRRAMASHFPQSSEEYLLSFSSKKETATIFCNLFDAIEHGSLCGVRRANSSLKPSKKLLLALPYVLAMVFFALKPSPVIFSVMVEACCKGESAWV